MILFSIVYCLRLKELCKKRGLTSKIKVGFGFFRAKGFVFQGFCFLIQSKNTHL